MQGSHLARHVWALACAALLLDVLAVVASPFVTSIVPGFHYLVVTRRALPGVLGVLGALAVVHVLLAVAVWQRLRYGKEPSSRSPT